LLRFQTPSGSAGALGEGHLVEVVKSTCGEVQRWMPTSSPAGAKIPLRFSASYAAMTASIGSPNSTGQRCA
jgi:hypothetical protein